jgi:membrane associated rhomboid family serine protease
VNYEHHALVESEADARRLRRAFLLALGFAGFLWLIQIVSLAFGLDFTGYAVFPGRVQALSGILFAPLLHGSVSHLLANTSAVLVLGTALLYGYPKAARIALPVIWLGAGLAVWLLARPAYHLGASGLTFGALFFVFTLGVLRWDRRAIALALVVFLLYGGMIWGVLPGDPGVSFEYHLAGAALGVLLALLLKDADPPPPARVYSWERGDEEDDWPFPEIPGDPEPPRER